MLVKPRCLSSEYILVEDAVHVVLAADWQDAGWAAAQVWPDGTRVAAESVGRISHRVASPRRSAPVRRDSDRPRQPGPTDAGAHRRIA